MTPKAKQRNSYLLRTYGITLKQYLGLLEGQGGGCAVCGRTPSEEGRNLAVDHDHKTREIFGLLCLRCNKYLIGRIRDSSLFAAAAAYLYAGTGLFTPVKKKRRKRKKRRKAKR